MATSIRNLVTGGVLNGSVNLLPVQTGNSGKFLTTNGTNTAWVTPTAVDVGASSQSLVNLVLMGL